MTLTDTGLKLFRRRTVNNKINSAPLFLRGNSFSTEKSAFVNIPALRPENIRTEDYYQKNNYNDPFPTAEKALVIIIAHINHLAYFMIYPMRDLFIWLP